MTNDQLKAEYDRLSNQYRLLQAQHGRYLREGKDVTGTRLLQKETWAELEPVRAEMRRAGLLKPKAACGCASCNCKNVW